jgi:acetyl esterase/lipase
MRIIPHLALLCIAAPLPADEPTVHKGIPYAETRSARQMLDVYAPASGKNKPVIVWMHGGGWRKGDKADVHNKPKAFTEKGIVLVSINYRLVPNVTIKEMTGDVAKAIRWVHRHAKDYGGDPKSIIVMGHSAGAQLAALVCTDDRYLKAEDLPLSIIKGCVPVDGGTYDVVMQVKTVDEKRANSLRTTFGDEASQKELSAVTHVAKATNIPPFLLLHIADNPETKSQAQRLAKVLNEAGISAKSCSAEGKTHTSINVDLGLADDRPTQEMWAFLNAVLKK